MKFPTLIYRILPRVSAGRRRWFGVAVYTDTGEIAAWDDGPGREIKPKFIIEITAS